MRGRRYTIVEVIAVYAILAVVAHGVIAIIRDASLENRRLTRDAWSSWQGHLVRHEWQRWCQEVADPERLPTMTGGTLRFAFPERERRLPLPEGATIAIEREAGIATLTISWSSSHLQRQREHRLRLVSRWAEAAP